MALANDNPPVAATDLDNILIGDFLETWRDQRDPFRIRVLALVDLGRRADARGVLADGLERHPNDSRFTEALGAFLGL